MTTAQEKRVMTLANRITMVRILSVPLFILALFYYLRSTDAGAPNEMWRRTALSIFLAASLTDALDGYLARKRSEVTRLGRMVDPLADKSLLLSAIIMLTRFHPPTPAPSLPPWFSLLVISRDAILLLGAWIVHALTGSLDVRPRWIGKCATVLQMAAVVWVLTGFSSAWFYIFLIVVSAATFLAGVQYVFDGLRQLERASETHHVPSQGGGAG
jgi:cardiolipin synthase